MWNKHSQGLFQYTSPSERMEIEIELEQTFAGLYDVLENAKDGLTDLEHSVRCILYGEDREESWAKKRG